MRLSLDRSWRFHLGDIDTPLADTHLAAYMNNKAGYARGPAKTNYDDSDWRLVDLPHDWSVEGAFSPENHMDAGYLPRGVGWYRKYFRLDASDRGRHVEIRFDGVATHCTVYVNGHLLHRNFCGSTPFTVDVSDVATFGEALNTIAVKVDATWMEGWWYEGAGIYRDVELIVRERDHLENVFVSADASGRVQIDAELKHGGMSAPLMNAEAVPPPRAGRSCHVSHTIVGAEGKDIATGDEHDLHVTAPRLWSPDDPYLYTLRSQLIIDDRVVDEVQTRFGFRTLRFDADTGFYLNEQRTFLNGVCLHQDHAGVGVAVPASIERFRLLQLKSIGVNAVRCAHNPPSKTFLDLCDELGLLVMNELRNFGASPEHLRQLEAVVKRDRNHPSVILWSVCNEEAIQGSPVAANIARSMVTRLRELDPTRPITGAVSGALLDDVGLAGSARVLFDVMSINYNLPLHDAFHQKHPDLPVIVSETGCTYATRGVTQTDADKHHFAEDDTAFAPWGASARATWEHVRARPYLAGMFVWTGIDYRGEPTPHAWPSVNSHWGLFDLCCFPKRAAQLHQTLFESAGINSPPLAGVREAKPCPRVGGGGESRDGALLSSSSPPVPPPNLPRKGGGVDAGDSLRIEIPEVFRPMPIEADGRFTIPLTIHSPVDEPITIDLAGPARLLGVGNGDPTSHVNQGNTIPTFNGLAQVLIQTTTTPGEITIRARSSSGEFAAGIISVKPASPIPRAEIVFPRHLLTGWRMSPITTDKPDPNVIVSDGDMNTWERIDPSAGPRSAWTRTTGTDPSTRCFALYRAKLTLPKAMQSAGCVIRFHRALGEVEAFLDGAPVSSRSTGGDSFEIDCAGSASPRTLTLRVASTSGPAGLAGPVELLPPDSSPVS